MYLSNYINCETLQWEYYFVINVRLTALAICTQLIAAHFNANCLFPTSVSTIGGRYNAGLEDLKLFIAKTKQGNCFGSPLTNPLLIWTYPHVIVWRWCVFFFLFLLPLVYWCVHLPLLPSSDSSWSWRSGNFQPLFTPRLPTQLQAVVPQPTEPQTNIQQMKE